METELVISGVGLPPLSARGCVQELVPLAMGQFRRTVNGDLVFLGTNGKKYRTSISCEDKAVIATDGLEVGSIVEVSCIQRLWQKSNGGKIELDRIPVPGSVHVIDEQHNPLPIICYDHQEITIASQQPCYISYRPILTMRITRYFLKTDEWGVKTGWQMELEEV